MSTRAPVLVVDHDGGVRRLVAAALRDHPTLRVVPDAVAVDDAVERCRELRPAVVLLDQELPQVARDDMVTRIRELSPVSRVVLCSADDAAVDALLRTIEHEATAAHVRTWAFDAETVSAGVARDLVSTALAEWGCERLVPDVQLVVSELVTNAVVHAGSRCVLRLRLMPGAVRVEVTDAGDGSPQPLPADGERIGGRGLLIVAAVSRAWGIDPAEPAGASGKTVWAELTIESVEHATAS